jgi:hypothetical protein
LTKDGYFNAKDDDEEEGKSKKFSFYENRSTSSMKNLHIIPEATSSLYMI